MGDNNSLSPAQLAQMRAQIESEYRKDLEALERVARFLPKTPAARPVPPPPAEAAATPAPVPAVEEQEDSQIEAMLSLVTSNFNRTYTAREVFNELRRLRVPLSANEKQALATVGTSLQKLSKRGKIRCNRKGKGRKPSIYQGYPPMGMASMMERGLLTQ